MDSKKFNSIELAKAEVRRLKDEDTTTKED